MQQMVEQVLLLQPDYRPGSIVMRIPLQCSVCEGTSQVDPKLDAIEERCQNPVDSVHWWLAPILRNDMELGHRVQW